MRFEIEHGDSVIVFHHNERVLWNGTRPTRLTEHQAMLLHLLCTMPGQCLSRVDYAQALTGREWDPRQRLPMDQHIHNLRRVGVDIASKRGVGYELRGDVRRLDDTDDLMEWRPEAVMRRPGDDVPGLFWFDDRGHWLPATPDHEQKARQLLGVADIGASIYLIRRSGFVQLYLGGGWLRAVFDEASVAHPAVCALHDFILSQEGFKEISLETVARGTIEFRGPVEALNWLQRTQRLADHIAPGSVIEEVMDVERCELPPIRDLVTAWRTTDRGIFYDAMRARIRHARGHRVASEPIQRILCIEHDADGEPIYTEVGPGILLFGANTAHYLRGRRVRDQAAPGYAQRAAEHYRRALQSDQPILACIRSSVRLEHGVQPLTHLRLSLPALTSGGRKRALVARTVNI